MNSLILDGAKIGKNTIIGAMSFVSKEKEIPDNVLAYGNPIRVIRNLTEDEIRQITGYSERNRKNAYENYLKNEDIKLK
jgi:carbonic anhydrase/acetyltransferase-like protein (isoleucine patch superfamily)